MINRIWGYLCLSFIYLHLTGCSSEEQFNNIVLAEKWVSASNPKCEIWFQNWGDYQRLFMVINSDTMEIKPSPYVTEKKDKPYLTPKPYNKVSKQQLKGNIYTGKAFPNGNLEQSIMRDGRLIGQTLKLTFLSSTILNFCLMKTHLK